MGRKKRSSATANNVNHGAQQQQGNGSKKAKNSTGESYMVKKYRAEKTYAAMEAFVRYTKAHRMLDASYFRWYTGVTPEKPFVFSTRVGGVDLGWGRGKSREAAMDCACRATFALVNAHGYKNFPIDDDCLTEAPVDAPPPPPPPPPPIAPPLPGYGLPPPPLPAGMPPIPVGMPPPLPTGPPPPPPPDAAADLLIPQPKIQMEAPVASSLSLNAVSTTAESSTLMNKSGTTTLSLNLREAQTQQDATKPSLSSRHLKGGLTLVFDPGMEGPEEMCMEELRASLHNKRVHR